VLSIESLNKWLFRAHHEIINDKSIAKVQTKINLSSKKNNNNLEEGERQNEYRKWALELTFVI